MRIRGRRYGEPRRRVKALDRLGLYERLLEGPLTFEKVHGPDLPRVELRDLDQRVFPDGFQGGYGMPLSPRGRAMVARTARSMAAYALWLPALGDPDDCWYLDTVAVAPERRGEGIGTQLIHQGTQWLLADEARSVRATPLIGADRERRRLWLSRLGFEETEVGMIADITTVLEASR